MDNVHRSFIATVRSFIGGHRMNLTRLADHLECAEATVRGWADGDIIPDTRTRSLVLEVVSRWQGSL